MSYRKRREKNQKIINQLNEEYKEAAFWLPFEALQIKDVFSQEELAKLGEFIDEMDEATDDNDRVARLVEKAADYGSVIVKVLKLAKVLT